MPGWTRRELLAGASGALVAGGAAGLARADLARGAIVYNTDADGIDALGAGTPGGYLATRFDPILHTEVGTVSQCTGVTTIFTHAVPVGENFGEYRYGDQYDSVRAAACAADAICSARYENINSLRRWGTDVLRLGLAFCRRNGLRHAFSYRVNDAHDAFEPWELTLWKRTHPQYMLGRPGDSGDPDSPLYWWSALNFEHGAVREYLYRILASICRRYDLHILELDYLRAPLMFPPHMEGRPATEHQTDLLTGWQRRLRGLTRRIGAHRGRPLPLAARVPPTVGKCHHVGIDIERWIMDGLVDELRLSGGYMPFTEPIGSLATLAHSHRVKVQGAISASGMPAPYDTVPAWRGAAANIWFAGVDGIYTFNLFPTGPDPRLEQIGAPGTLVGLNKLFAIEPQPVLLGLVRQAIVQDAILPAAVPAHRILPVGDDVGAAARHGRLRDAVLRVQLSEPAMVDSLDVTLNGTALTAAARDVQTGWLTFRPRPDRWRHGANRLEFSNSPLASVPSRPTEVTAVELTVRYRR